MPLAQSSTSAFQKPLRVLKALTDPGAGRLTDIARAAGLDTTSTFRALQVLVQEGLVQRDPESKRYQFGDEAYVLAAALAPRRDVRSLARPSLLRLADLSGNLVSLVVRSGFESVVVDREAGNFPLQLSTMTVGSRRPLGLGAGSLALIAWTDDQDVEEVLAHVEAVLREHYTLTVATIRAEVAAARERGYVRMFGAVVPDVGAIARAIRGLDGRICGAISISGLAKAITPREKLLADSLAAEVEEIEKALRHAPPAPGSTAVRG